MSVSKQFICVLMFWSLETISYLHTHTRAQLIHS